jgi:predicted kinase
MSLELVIFSGLQASGKTTFYRERFAATHLLVSKDLWPNARRREERQRRVIEDALRQRRSVVVDNTNPSPLERAPLVALGRAFGARLLSYWFVSTVPESISRNAARSGRARIDDVGIHSVAKRLVAPAHAEGFDSYFEVRISASGFDVRVANMKL